MTRLIRLRDRLLAVAAVAGLAAVLAACGAAASTHKSGPVTTPKHLVLNSSGLPVLSKGTSIAIGDGGPPAPGATDTNAWLTSQLLAEWGASTTYTIAGGAAPEDSVVSGALTETNGPMSLLLDSGLTVFCPNQVHVDWELVSTHDTTLSQLVGQKIANLSATSTSSYIQVAVLKKKGISASKVTEVYTGSNVTDLTVLLNGDVQAAWIHSTQNVPTPGQPTLHVLAKGSTYATFLADSYLGAKESWLKAHPAYAEAIILAWIKAANIFDYHENQWLKDAQTYTDNVSPISTTRLQWQAEHSVNAWGLQNEAEMTASALQQNYDAVKAQGVIHGDGVRPLSQIADLSVWNAAWSIYQHHKAAYEG